jgi:hypothetical protein
LFTSMSNLPPKASVVSIIFLIVSGQGHVSGTDCHRACRELLCSFFVQLQATSGDNDLRSLTHKLLGNGKSDPRTSTRDECYFSCQFYDRTSSLFAFVSRPASHRTRLPSHKAQHNGTLLHVTVSSLVPSKDIYFSSKPACHDRGE